MTKVVEDALIAFVQEKSGKILDWETGKSLKATLVFSGRELPCRFWFQKFLVRTDLFVESALEDPDCVNAFAELVLAIDHNGSFMNRIVFSEERVIWTFDILIPDCSLPQLFSLWYEFAEDEVKRIDNLLRIARESNAISEISIHQQPVDKRLN